METRNQTPWLYGTYANVPCISDELVQNVQYISDVKPCLRNKEAESNNKWQMVIVNL
jgi:hypothetical protein